MNSKGSKGLVFVAMSGGVDSSLAAVLLAEQGYDVVGVTLKLWDYDEVGGNTTKESVCCSLEMINDARTVCQHLGVPHYVLDMKEEFKTKVIENFISEYKKGRTPYPCIACNRLVKWQALWQKISGLGADFIATGHYARVQFNQTNGRYQILKGVDATRDQSYALWGLSQEDLSRTLFPLGGMTKMETRRLAAEYNLKTARKAESQDLCFVPDGNLERFFKEWEGGTAEVTAGPIYTQDGEQVAEHKGLPFYTIGQRKGLGVAFGTPRYVTNLDPKRNAVVIGEDEDLQKSGFSVADLNWISISAPESEMTCDVKIRYLHHPARAIVKPLPESRAYVRFECPERAITPGQSAVFYDGDILLGGGVIESVAG